MDVIKEWVSNLFIIIMMLTFTEILLPQGDLGKYIKFVFSLVIMTALIYPVVHLMKS